MKTLNVSGDMSPLIESTDRKSRLRNELIAFWARNPHGRFTASVISGALDCRKWEVKAVLDDLYANGLIKTCVIERLTFYSLAGDLSKREYPFQCSTSERE